MKNILLISVVILMFTSCISNNKKDTAEGLNGAHKVVVKEVLQANVYTYLNVTENGIDQWIAVPKMPAEVGEVYYFDEFLDMKYFESKYLGRIFESVYFIQGLKSELGHEGHKHAKEQMPVGKMSGKNHEGKPGIAKEEVKIESVEGGITIAELFANKKKYNGKKVVIRGKIVKINLGIMDKNWFHIQDGTSAEGNYDLTITSMEEDVKHNDILTFEGTVTLDKDFGYGYSYEVLLEDGVIKTIGNL